jgi:hypothetical protein
MSAAWQLHAGRPARIRTIAAAAVAVAAVAGWFLGGRLARGPGRPAPATVTAVYRGLSVTTDSSWIRLRRVPRLPGFDGASTLAYAPYAGLDTVVAAAVLSGSRPSLLPAALAGGAGEPVPTTLAGAPAWLYAGLRAGRWRMDVLTAPTTRGVLTVACATPGAGIDVAGGCLDGLRGISVAGAKRLRPDAGTELRLRLPGAVAALDTARLHGRRALGDARTPAGQATAADGLRRAYAAAAATLAPLAEAATPGAALVGALRTTASGYGRLALAARHRDAAAWRHALAAVRRAEATLAGRLAAAD